MAIIYSFILTNILLVFKRYLSLIYWSLTSTFLVPKFIFSQYNYKLYTLYFC